MLSSSLVKIGTSLKPIINFNRFLSLRRFSISVKNNKQKNVAMVLSGCGVYDGVEIVEAASAIIHLSKHNVNISFYAPNIEQLHVVNHLTGAISPENRNVLVESARIARGNIKPIENLHASNFDALVIPGGFGSAKNLCDYAIKGSHMTVIKDIERIVNEFVVASKPMGFCCISPVICAKMFPSCKITLGMNKSNGEWPYCENIDSLRLMGAEVIEKDVNQIQVDNKFKIVTTPAFMKNATFYQVFDGIGKMVDEVVKMA